MAIDTYPLPEDDEQPTWGTFNAEMNGKCICRCLRFVADTHCARVRAHRECPNCDGFGIPSVPFGELLC